MRGSFLSIIVMVAACGGNHNGESICQTAVPPPPECMDTCDPTPGAANTCPAGYHCTPDGKCDAQCTTNGNQCGDGYHCTSDGQCLSDTACVNLECNIVDCASMNLPLTSISGKVFAPNGTLPLYGINVYVPNADPGPLPDGAVCSRCQDDLPGMPIVKQTTDEAGHFQLLGVPAGDNIPVVIETGKWRREFTIPHVNQCADNAVDATDSSLPKSATDMTPNTTHVDLPKIAITTGNADSLECLIRKLGVADSEITTNAGAGHVHLYVGNGVGKFTNGQTMSSATPFWGDVNNLKPYDIVILSCEGNQNSDTKPQPAMDAMKAYADLGGRVFASHWHNIWIGGVFQPGNAGNQKPAVWSTIATWDPALGDPGSPDVIDETNNPKGSSFATWMLDPLVMGSTVRDQIAIQNGTDRSTCSAVDNTKAERWTYASSSMAPQNFQFTTPNETTPDMRCGKVVFSDMHVSGGPGTGDYPDECGTSLAMSPQEKALAFMLFDISSCVGTIF